LLFLTLAAAYKKDFATSAGFAIFAALFRYLKIHKIED